MPSFILRCAIAVIIAANLAAVDVDTLLTEDTLTVRDAIHRASPNDAVAILRAIPRTGRTDLYGLTLEFLDSPQARVVEGALNGLERTPVAHLADHLHQVRDLLTHDDSRIRWLSARLLGELKDDYSVDPLITLLSDQDSKVVDAAHKALVAIFGMDIGRDPVKWEAYYVEWLITDEEGIPRLAAQLEETNDPNQQLQILHRLIANKSHRHAVGDILLEYRDSDDPQVAAIASIGIKNLGGVAAMKAAASSGGGGGDSSGYDINDLLAEAEAEASGPVATLQVATAEPEPEGLSTSQVVTIIVLILVAVGGGLAFRSLLRTREKGRRPPPSSGGTRHDDQPGDKPRITFSS